MASNRIYVKSLIKSRLTCGIFDFFQCKIDFYYTKRKPKAVFFFTSGEAMSEILLLVFMSEIKIDFTLKKSNFLFSVCFNVAIIQYILVRQPLGQRHNIFF